MTGVRLGTSKRAKTHIVRSVFRTHVATHCGRFTKQPTFPLTEHKTRVCGSCARAMEPKQIPKRLWVSFGCECGAENSGEVDYCWKCGRTRV